MIFYYNPWWDCLIIGWKDCLFLDFFSFIWGKNLIFFGGIFKSCVLNCNFIRIFTPTKTWSSSTEFPVRFMNSYYLRGRDWLAGRLKLKEKGSYLQAIYKHTLVNFTHKYLDRFWCFLSIESVTFYHGLGLWIRVLVIVFCVFVVSCHVAWQKPPDRTKPWDRILQGLPWPKAQPKG